MATQPVNSAVRSLGMNPSNLGVSEAGVLECHLSSMQQAQQGVPLVALSQSINRHID